MADEKNATPPTAQAAAQLPQDEAAPTADPAEVLGSKNEEAKVEDAFEDKPMEPAESSDAPKEPAEPTTDHTTEAPPTSQTVDVEPAPATASTPVDKSKAARRKSGALGSVKKKLSKKGSKARILHLDAKPGDHYFVKLKGYPTWPVIICSEDMLPQPLLNHRPVSAAHADGTYRQDFADGGKRVADRTFPVMYLQTNEFGWVSNQDLHDLDPNTVLEMRNDKMRRDLQDAYALAAEQHPLEHYRELLAMFEQEKEETAVAKAASASKKTKKTKAVSPEDEDMSMPDATEDEGKAKSRKRKAEDDGQATQRSDSVKKPKIKLTTTPKTANGASAKPGKEAGRKVVKPKAKKGDNKREEKEAPKEPVMTSEERHIRKEKEVLFLRHKLQRGLLTRDQEPKAEEMVSMSEYLAKLEGFPGLEASIIKKTKINKVLRAILRLESIPKEEDFKFKSRSQVMLDKWNKLLAADAVANPSAANGINGTTAATSEAKAETRATNGVKKDGDEAEKLGGSSKRDETEKTEAGKSEERVDKVENDEDMIKEGVAA